MLKITIKSNRSTFYEMQARHFLSQIKQLEDDLDILGARNYFQYGIAHVPKKSYCEAIDCFKFEIAEDYMSAEIWHLDGQGDKDRLIATIERAS